MGILSLLDIKDMRGCQHHQNTLAAVDDRPSLTLMKDYHF